MNAMQLSYRITVVDTVAGLEELAKPWTDLLNESRSNTIFLTWEWLLSWTECFLKDDRRLFVLLVYRGNELIGLAPWYIRHLGHGACAIKQIGFLGGPETGSDHLDIIARRGKEKEVARQIYQFLKRSPSYWDRVGLEGISSESLFLLYFSAEIEEEGRYAEFRHGAYCPSVALPRTVEAFKAQLSANRRQQFSRHLRLLGKEGEVRHHVYQFGDVAASLEDLRQLYEQRWGDSAELFHFLDRFVMRCEGRDWVQIDLVRVGGRNIAGLLHFNYSRVLSMYLMAVDHSFEKGISVGNIVIGLSIERAIGSGSTVYDFLKGTEDYKFHWSNDGKREGQLFYYAKKPVPVMWMLGQCAKAVAKVLLR